MSAQFVASPIAPGRKAAFIAAPRLRRPSYGANHPLAIPRVALTLDLATAFGAIEPGELVTARQAADFELEWFHAREYVAAIRTAETLGQVKTAWRERFGLGTLENPYFAGLFAIPATATGASVQAAEQVLAGRVAFNPAGRHASRASGPRTGVLLLQRSRTRGHSSAPCRAARPLRRPRCSSLRRSRGGVRRRSGGADPLAPHGHRLTPTRTAAAVSTIAARPRRDTPRSMSRSRRASATRSTGWSSRPHGRARSIGSVRTRSCCRRARTRCRPTRSASSRSRRKASSPSRARSSTRARAMRTARRDCWRPGEAGIDPIAVARAWTGLWGVLSGRALGDAIPPRGGALLRSIRWEQDDD